MKKRHLMGIACLVAASHVTAAGLKTVTFDELNPGESGYWNGEDLAGGFWSVQAWFGNTYTDWGDGWYSWAGFAYSRVNDPEDPSFQNQYAVISGTDISGTGTYAVVYDDAWDPNADTITLPKPSQVRGFYINNTTYAALAMRDGNWFAKKFGGASGNDPDWFKLEIAGRDAQGHLLGTVEHYLADFRSANSDDDYIQNEWEWVDLTPLGPRVKTLHFTLSSSDVGEWGMNTPAYFAMDHLAFVARTDWRRQTDFAVQDVDLDVVGPRNRLAVDVTVRNLGGKAGEAALYVVVQSPGRRQTIFKQKTGSLRPMGTRTFRIRCNALGAPNGGTHGVTVHVVPRHAREEIDLENNMATDALKW